MTRRSLLALAAFALATAPLGARPAWGATNTVAVAAAADLKFALDELLVGFRAAHPEIAVTVSYGSSGTFATQLQHGAPFDVYLSADLAYPRDLEAKGLVLPGSTFEYAVGRLVLWVPNASTLDVATRGMDALRDPAVRHVAIANPLHAPYGRAAEAAMRAAGVYDAVHSKLVYGENVAQTAQFVQSGAADAGLVALSLAVSPAMASTGRYWEVPLSTYPQLDQGGCILNAAQDPAAARALVAWLSGEQGRAVLKKYGFYMPEER